MSSPTAFGLTAGSREGHARLGAELARLGYGEAWCNDTRRGDGLATLAELARGARDLPVGVGVIAVSEQTPARVAERVRECGIPPSLLTVGVGSGASASLALVRDGVAELRRLLPDHRIGVAAVGPRMARLAGEVADAVVANWAVPDRLRFVRDRVAEGAATAGRRPPLLVAYVRTAVGQGAVERLRREQARYAGFGPHYARAFATQPDELVGVAVESADPAEAAAGLEPYRETADTVVVRGLPETDDVEAWLEVARAASPLTAAW